jgi:hypothetical protein
LTLQIGGGAFAFFNSLDGDVPGALVGVVVAKRASFITGTGGALSIVSASISALNGDEGPAISSAINKTIARELAPEGTVRDVIEASLDKLDTDPIEKALGCKQNSH